MKLEYKYGSFRRLKSINPEEWFILMFMFSSVIAWVLTIYFYVQKHHFLEKTVEKEATVKAMKSYGFCYRPVYEFELNGKKVVAVDPICSSPAPFYIGYVTTILYDQENPLQVVHNTFFEKWFEVLIVGIIACSFSAATWALRWVNIKSNTKRESKVEPLNPDQRINEIFLLETHDEYKITHPTEKQLIQALTSVTGKDYEFVVLSKGDCFIQYGGAKVDFRDESLVFYSSVRDDFSVEEIIKMFLCYANQDLDWKKDYDWVKEGTLSATVEIK